MAIAPAPAPAPQATGTLEEAASAFESLLSPEGELEEGATPEAAQETADKAEPQAADAEAAQETPQDEVAAEEDAPADAEETEEAPPEPQLVTVKVNGKVEQLPIEEVAKGYQRQADYSQKTADLADQRRTLAAEAAAVKEERAQYAQLLTALKTQLESGGQEEPNWQTLYDENPLEYVRQKDIWRERQDRAAAAQYETQRIQALQTQEQQAALQQAVAKGRTELIEAMPEWKDAKKWDADRVKLLDYGKKLGFTDQELGNTYDPRAVIALHKARLYDELKAAKPVPAVRKAPAPLAAGNAQSVTRQATSDETKAKQRLAKTGSIRDAAAVFEKFL